MFDAHEVKSNVDNTKMENMIVVADLANSLDSEGFGIYIKRRFRSYINS